MSTEKPTILLIPGAWHKAHIFDAVIDILQSQGYPVVTKALLSAGGPVSTAVADDAEHIRQAYLNDLVAQGKEVVVVMHSYAGVPGTESIKGLARKDLAAQGKQGGVVALVYLAAFMLPAGKSVEATVPQGLDPAMTMDGDMTYAKGPRESFYNDLDDETAAKYVAELVHHAKPSFCTPLTYEAYRDVPTRYLLCKQDACIPFILQQIMAAMPGEGLVRTHECEAGHVPMLGVPQAVADVIHAAATETRERIDADGA